MGKTASALSKAALCVIISVTLVLTCAMPAFADQAQAASFTSSKPKGAMASAVRQKAWVTWEGVKGADGYEVYESVNGGDYRLVRRTTKKKIIRKGLIKGKEYSYYIYAYRVKDGKKQLSKKSRTAETTVPKKAKSTIKNFLSNAKAPIGSTMYVFGGGWNAWSRSAGTQAKRTGLSPEWRKFASKQNKKYNHWKYFYRSKKGLDCTGFLGWCVYNTLNTENGKSGYVFHSSQAGKVLAAKKLGKWTGRSKVKSHKAGDVMAANGHVWIVVGDCSDGSTVLIHSSPPGVRLAGTPNAKGKKNSEAAKLARAYMKKYYPKWYRMFPNVYTKKNYRKNYGRMRWYSSVLADPDGYKKMDAAGVLEDLFGPLVDPEPEPEPETPDTPDTPDTPEDPENPVEPGTPDDGQTGEGVE